MNKFNKSPSEQLIIALLSFLNEKKASYQKISVLKTYTIKWHYYSFIKIICIFEIVLIGNHVMFYLIL